MLSLLRARGALGASSTIAAASSSRPHEAHDPAAELVLAAMSFLDLPYLWGGTNAGTGFDCSGFTRHVFATALGLALPRRSAEQARAVTLAPVARGELRPGDLVFFNTLRQAFSHVGLYIGDGRFVHAPRRGAQVRVDSLQARYWASRFDGARRAWGQQPDGAGGIAAERLAR
ncbi:MAG: C40 family peptidase [Burkholderiales bacterium]|nr:C40 family peptidase [Burkholderiales bacterium]